MTAPAGAGTVTGSPVIADAAGVAAFTTLAVSGTPGTYTLQLASGPATASSSLTLSVGPAAGVSLTTAPSGSAQSGVVFAQQPAVLVTDAAGNPVPGQVVTVTAGGGASVLNGTAVSDATGHAAFTNLAVSGAVGAYTLTYTAGTASTTSGLTLAAGNATTLTVTLQPSAAAQNGVALAVQPEVRVTDGTNPVAGVVVTASLTSAGATVGNATAVSNASGHAIFSGLHLAGTVGSYTLRFAASGVTAVQALAPTALSAGPAAKLVLATQPSATAVNAAALASQPVVQITDAGGNVVTSQPTTVVTASIAGGGPSLANAAVLSSGGVATFSGLALTGAVGTWQLRFTAPGLDSVDASAATVLQPGPAVQLALTTQPSASAASGVALAQQPVVRVVDISGNLVTGSSAVITAATTAGASLAGASATAAGGVASFSGLTLTGTAGSYPLSFSAPGVTGVSAASATMLGAGAASQLTLTTQPSATARSGIALAQQPAVQLRDASGNAAALPGVLVTASVVGGGVTVVSDTATTSPAGVATFGVLALSGPVGSYTLRFAAAGVTGVDAAAPTALAPGAPDTLVIVTPPPATAVNGVALSTAPVLEVRDAAGNPVPDSVVTVTATGGVTLTAASVAAAPDGRATFTGLTLTGTVAGYNLQFCVGACGTASVSVSAPQPVALQPGPPATLTITAPPSAAAQSGVPLAAQPVVTVTDGSGNAVPGAVVTVTAGAAVVSGGSAVANASGVATFTTLTVAGAPAGYTLQLASGTATATSPLALAVGPAASVSFSTAPSGTAQSGVVLATQPAVLVLDGTGNPIPGATVTAAADGGASVLNATATTNGAGLATFDNLAVIGTVGLYTLTFSAGAASTTAGLTLSAGAAASLAVIVEPSTTASNGLPLATQPAVEVRDAGNNPLPGVVVTASLTAAGATVGNALAVTDGAGLATFAGLSLSGTVGSYTLRFSANASTTDAAAPTALGAGPAAKLVLATPPSATAQNGVALTSQPVVRITDAGGNVVTAQPATVVTASVVGGGPSLTNATATTAAGVATFGGLTLTGVVGTYTLRFTAPGLDSVDAAAATVLLPGVATALELVTQPSSSTPAGVVLAQTPVVRLRDASGNTVPQPGRNITVSVANPAVTFLGAVTVPTDGTGHAAFDDLGVVGPRGRYLMRFGAASLPTVAAAESTTVAKPLALAVPVSDSAGFDVERPYVVQILPGDTLLTVQITGGAGTADLVVRYGAAPDIDHGQFDCYPRLAGNEETCVFRNPAPGDWYITLVGFPFSFAGVTLVVNSYP